MVLGVINRVRRITVDFEMGAYDAFKNVFGHSIDCIQKDYAFAKRDVMASQGGQPIRLRSRRQATRYNINITNLCVQYRNNVWTNNIFEYLRRISHNVRYN